MFATPEYAKHVIRKLEQPYEKPLANYSVV